MNNVWVYLESKTTFRILLLEHNFKIIITLIYGTVRRNVLLVAITE